MKKPAKWKWSETGFQNFLRMSVVGDFDSTQKSLKKENLRKRELVGIQKV